MSYEKRLIIINYGCMAFGGGIENLIYDIVRNADNNRFDFVWISDWQSILAKEYEAEFIRKSVKVIKCETRGFSWAKHEKIDYSGYKEAVILSFNVYDHARAIEMAHKKSDSGVKVFPCFYLPHFTSPIVLPEQAFYGVVRKLVKKAMKIVYYHWYRNRQLCDTSDGTHVKAVIGNYKLSSEGIEVKRFPIMREWAEFDEEKVRERYKREEFVILTAGRMVFPHKGYLIGLIDAFVNIHKIHKNVKLVIVGEGEGENIVKEKIKTLSKEARECISVRGNMEMSRLRALMQECNVNIAVAACAYESIILGVPTLVARHYSYACEVYDSYPLKLSDLISCEPGHPVEGALNRLIESTEEQYVDFSRKAYYNFPHQEADTGVLFEGLTDISVRNYYCRDMAIVKSIYYFDKISRYCRRIIKNK